MVGCFWVGITTTWCPAPMSLTQPDVLLVREKVVSYTLLLNKTVCRRTHYCPEKNIMDFYPLPFSSNVTLQRGTTCELLHVLDKSQSSLRSHWLTDENRVADWTKSESNP